MPVDSMPILRVLPQRGHDTSGARRLSHFSHSGPSAVIRLTGLSWPQSRQRRRGRAWLALVARRARGSADVASHDRFRLSAACARLGQVVTTAPLTPRALDGVRDGLRQSAAHTTRLGIRCRAAASRARPALRGVAGGGERPTAHRTGLRHTTFPLIAPRAHRTPVTARDDSSGPATQRARFGPSPIVAGLAPCALGRASCGNGRPSAARTKFFGSGALVAGMAQFSADQKPVSVTSNADASPSRHDHPP
jgi:hypothetical protein